MTAINRGVDLFAGPGGWDVAAARLGVIMLGIESDMSACTTRNAAGLTTIYGDVSTTNPVWYDAPLQVGSPPCQGFSTAGSGKSVKDARLVLEWLSEVNDLADLEAAIEALRPRMTDARTLLVLEPLRWALTTMPTRIAWEQVPPVLPLWEACARILRNVGYAVVTSVLHAEQYGVPQTRRRAVLMARLGAPVNLPTPTHSRYHTRQPERLDDGVLPWVSMAQALGWAPGDLVGFPRAGDERGPQVEIDGQAYRARDLRTADQPAFGVTSKIRSTVRFMRPEHADEDMQVESMGDVRNSHGTIRRIDQPSPTITSSMDNGNFQFVGSGKGVRVSVAEAGQLQTFDADYAWRGTKTQQYQQVGNAIPPLLAEAILQELVG